MFSNMVRGVFSSSFFFFPLHHFGFWRSRRPRQQQSSMTYWKWIVCVCIPSWWMPTDLVSYSLTIFLWLVLNCGFSNRIYYRAPVLRTSVRESLIFRLVRFSTSIVARPSKSESGTQRLLNAAQQLLSFFPLSRNVFETFVTCRHVQKSHSGHFAGKL